MNVGDKVYIATVHGVRSGEVLLTPYERFIGFKRATMVRIEPEPGYTQENHDISIVNDNIFTTYKDADKAMFQHKLADTLHTCEKTQSQIEKEHDDFMNPLLTKLADALANAIDADILENLLSDVENDTN